MSTIQIRRGLQVDFDSYTLEPGELGYTTNTHKVYIGDTDDHNYLIGSAIIGTTAEHTALTPGEAGRIFHDTEKVETYIDDGTAWQLTGYTDLADMDGNLDDIDTDGTYGYVLNTNLTSFQVNQLDDGSNNVNASDLRTHLDNTTKHRIINDAGITTDELWSSEKINGEIDDKLQGISWQEPVLDQVDFVTTEPGSPSAGDRYINTATGTSSGTSQSVTEDFIYEWNGVDEWIEFVPDEGWAVYDEAADNQYNFNGSAWVTFGSTTSHNNTSGIQGGTTNSRWHLTETEYDDLTDGTDSTAHSHPHTQISDWDTAVPDDAGAMIVGGTHTGGISVEYHAGTHLLDIDLDNTAHNHDSIYYTQTEIDDFAAAGTSGASLIGVYEADLAHTSATDLQTVLDDLDQAITDTVSGGYSDEDVRFVVDDLLTDTVYTEFVYTNNGDATSEIILNVLVVDGGNFTT